MNPVVLIRRSAAALSAAGLVALVVLGGSYLSLEVLRFDPFRNTYTVTVQLATSGGLQVDNDVTLRGARVGTITAMTLTAHGVAALARIDSRYRIPQAGSVAVRNLSAAGEQYLDFSPDGDDGPYLGDGSVVDEHVSTPTQMVTVLVDSGLLLDRIDPHRMNVIVTELDKALRGGPDQLREVVTGLSLAAAGLERLLPQTTNLVANLRSVAATTTLAQPDLGTLARNSTILAAAADRSDAELRRLLDRGPGEAATIGRVLTRNTDPISRVVVDFAAITRAARLRTSALAVLFPSLRQGTAALGIPVHDGYFDTIVDIFAGPVCEYSAVPNPVGIVPNQGRVRLWNYCRAANPDLQVRGSANAPRPVGGNNGAQRPPGVDPNQMSAPNPNSSTW